MLPFAAEFLQPHRLLRIDLGRPLIPPSSLPTMIERGDQVYGIYLRCSRSASNMLALPCPRA